MIRFSSLFLALNILFCYGGLHREASAVIGMPEVKTIGACHGIGHESNAFGTSMSLRIAKDPAVQDTQCCQDALTNAHPDLNARIDVTIDRSYPHVVNESKSNLEKLLDGSPREHDPPDLQISFSTFLL